MKLFSPAKLNLFLLILGKRADGYHELASLFQAIDLGDTITYTLSHQDSLTCTDKALDCGNSNLIMQAVNLFRRKTGLKFSVAIDLVKVIPMEAGLGGGSSNAATTLWALNALHGSPYSVEELQLWGAELGSDVPFFLSQGTAYCTGRGEKIQPLPPLSLPPFSVLKPKEGISTPAVYRALNLNSCAKLKAEKLLEDFYTNEPFFHNDLELPALQLLPSLRDFKDQLHKQGFHSATLTGSGSAFFAFSPTSKQRTLRRAEGEWFNPNGL